MTTQSKYSPRSFQPPACLFALVALCLSVQPAGAVGELFVDDFESGYPCRWSTVNPATGCPPEFAGISLAASTGREQITLGWLPAVDDSTAPEDILYRIYMGDCVDPATLVTTVEGGTGLVLDGLQPSTTYCFHVVAEDEDGMTSHQSWAAGVGRAGDDPGLSITTLTLEQITTGTQLQTAASLNLGSPTQVTPTSLTFDRGGNAVAPTVGAVLMGGIGGPVSGPVGYIRNVDGVTLTATEIIAQTSDAAIETIMEQFEVASVAVVSPVNAGQKAAQDQLKRSRRATTGLPQPRPIVEATTERFGGRSGSMQVIPLESPSLYRIESVKANGPAKGDDPFDLEIGDDLTLKLDLDFTPEFRTSAKFGFGGVREAEIVGVGTLRLDALAKYHFNAAASYGPEDFPLLTTSWISIYAVGTVPVYQKITFSLEAQVTASASAEITAVAEAEATATLEVGVEYSQDDGWQPIVQPGFEQDFAADLSVVGGVQAEVRLIPTVTVEFYEAFAAWLSVEPSVSAEIQAQGTVLPPCFPLQLTQFDSDVEIEAKMGVDFTLFGTYPLYGPATLWDPDPWMLFSLPEVSLGASGIGPVTLTAHITDGANNDFRLESAEWWTAASGVELVEDPSNPTMATLTCDQSGTYDVVFYGNGTLGPLARRCTPTNVSCTGGGGGGGGGGGEITITLPGGVTMDLNHISADTFWMGSPVDERGRYDWEDLHQVTLTHGYYVGVTEVTQAQWEAVTGTPMSDWCGNHGVGPGYPVYCVSWDDIAGPGGFVDLLNAHLTNTGQPGAGMFRLPTEAEWERAARGATQTEFSFAAPASWDLECGSFAEAEPYMWWCGNNSPDGSKPVASKLENPYGLHDMHGNLWEWVEDWYTSHLGYNPVTDPSGPATGSNRVNRGGYWGENARGCRSAYRSGYPPSERESVIGFRLARSE